MYLFGGCNSGDNNDTFFTLDMNNMKWDVIPCRSASNNEEDVPKPRDEHTAVIVNK